MKDETLKEMIWKNSDGRCRYCGQPVNPDYWHLEHINPRSAGGKTVWDNLGVSCVQCNHRKFNRDVNGFRKWVIRKTLSILRNSSNLWLPILADYLPEKELVNIEAAYLNLVNCIENAPVVFYYERGE